MGIILNLEETAYSKSNSCTMGERDGILKSIKISK